MNNLEYIKEQYNQLPSVNDKNGLGVIRQKAFESLNKWGIPTTRHEEWKYTRIGSFFKAHERKDGAGEHRPVVTQPFIERRIFWR